MKVISPLFAVALAAAVYAPSVDASGSCSNPVSSCTGTCLKGTIDPTTTPAGSQAITYTDSAACTASDTLTGKRFLKSLRVSEDAGLGIVVTFKSGSAAITATPVAPATVDADATKNCYFTYADVGKGDTLTDPVSATVTCADNANTCAITYEAVWECQPKPCATLCSDASCVAKTVTAAATKVDLVADAKCPAYTYSYLKSLIVGTQYATDKVSVALGATTQTTTTGSVGTCYAKYGNLPTDLTALTADVTASVKCPDATADCAVKVKPEWACTDPKCTACAVGDSCTSVTQAANAADVVLTGASASCTGGKVAYLKSLDVRGKSDKNVVITFNNDLKPVPASSGANCYYYTNVASLKADATAVTATIKCTDATGCSFEHKAVWGCYTPAAGDTYTRTGATGANCVSDVLDCANRCAKSYVVGTLDTDKTYVPQFTTGCKCPSLSAVAATGLNSATTMTVVNTDATTMTIEYTAAGKACKSTYTKAAFANNFVEKSYTRTSTTEPACVPANNAAAEVMCPYKCAAEFAVTKPATVVDSINATRPAVAGCSCGDPTAAVVGDDGTTASGGSAALKYDFVYTAGTKSIALKTTTTSSATPPVTTTCNAVYKERCATVCTDATCADMTGADGANGLKLTKPDACPRWKSSYLKSLVVGSRVAGDTVAVKEKAADTNPVTVANDSPSGSTCYKKYGAIGSVASTTNTEPIITNAGGTVQVKAEWACSDANCPATCTDASGCQTPTLDTTTKSFTVTKANNPPSPVCGDTEVAYIKSLEVIGTSSVTFNNDLTPTAVSKGDKCAYYTDVINLKPGATDITATIKCNDPSKTDCAPKYNVEWGCYTPPVAANTYTRTTLTGADCVKDVTDCANRCAKSYMLGKQGTDQMFVPQLTGDCTCPRLTATPKVPATAPDGAAANSATKMDVAYDTSAATMTITYTGKDCAATYKKAAFANKFAAKTYTLATMTPTACATATDCTYKCAGEIVLTNPATITDAVNATQTAVADCTCADPIVAVVEGDSSTASGTVKTVKYDFSFTNTTSFKLTTTTPSAATPPGAATVCEAVYTEKVVTPATTTPAPTPSTTAPTPPATTVKTGTSAGVAATGADAGMVTVALMAAAAGAHAGMPVV